MGSLGAIPRELLKEMLAPRAYPLNSVGEESACNAGDLGLIPGLGRSPEEGNGNPLQYSYLENPMNCSLGSQESDTA